MECGEFEDEESQARKEVANEAAELLADIEDSTRRGFEAGEQCADLFDEELRKFFGIRLCEVADEMLDELEELRGTGFAACDYATALMMKQKPTHGHWNIGFPGVPIDYDQINNVEFVFGFFCGLAMPGEYEAFFRQAMAKHKGER